MKNNLFNKIIGIDNLLKSWNNVVLKNSATGSDKVSINSFSDNLKENIEYLHFELSNNLYTPRPVKIINKYKGICIVPVRDKIVQYAIKNILDEELSGAFIDNNFGYISNKSIYQAIDCINYSIYNSSINHFYKCDIHNFFANVSHELLINIIYEYIDDDRLRSLLNIIIGGDILKGDNLVENPKKGIVLGSPLSPLLSNIYLSKFDRDMSKSFDFYCRYSDDILIGKSEEFIISEINLFRNKLSELKLCENSKKSGFVNSLDGFEYLGYSFKDSYNISSVKFINNSERSRHTEYIPEVYQYIDNTDITHEILIKLTSCVLGSDFFADKIALYYILKNNKTSTEYAKVYESLIKNKISSDTIKKIDSTTDIYETYELVIEGYLNDENFEYAEALNNEYNSVEGYIESSRKVIDDTLADKYLCIFNNRKYFFVGTINNESDIEYVRVDRPLDRSDVNQLVGGKKCIAIDPVNYESSNVFIIDFDIKPELVQKYRYDNKIFDELLNQAKRYVLNVKESLKQQNVYSYIEFSGFKGYHLWIFFNADINCSETWTILKPYIEKVRICENISVEYMPYIDLHNLIRLPFSVNLISGIQSSFLDDTGKRCVNQLEVIEKIVLNDPCNISKTIKKEKIVYVDKDSLYPFKNYKKISDFPDYIQATYKNCNIMYTMVNKAIKEGYINHYERNAILYVFGHHGEEGKRFVHFVMSKCINYKQSVTEGFLARMKEKPVSCQKLMQRFSQYSDKCNCRFEVSLMFYKSPVLHGFEINNEVVTKPDYIDKDEKIVEILKINEELQINALANTLIELSGKKSELEKELITCKNELKRIFNDRKITSFNVDSGKLIMLKDDFIIKI